MGQNGPEMVENEQELGGCVSPLQLQNEVVTQKSVTVELPKAS